MQIEQYQRRETPTGSAGNVISRQPNSYAELGRLGQTITDVGFSMEEQRLQVQYNDEMSSAKLQVDKDFLEYQEGLDPNNTDEWERDLETSQENSRNKIKFKNGRAEKDFGVEWEQDKLYQKKAISTYRTQTDFKNASANYRNNRPLAIENAAKQPSEPQYRNAVLGWVRSRYGMAPIDPNGPISMDNLQTKEGYKDPLFQTDELRLSEVAAFLADADEAREKQLTKDQYDAAMMLAGTDPQGTLALFEKAIESGKAPQGYGLLDAGHWRAIKNIAEGTLRDRKIRAEALTQSQIEAVHNLAAKGAPYAEVVLKIDQSDALSGQQKTQLLKIYNDAVATRAKTGQNPYTTTQDWNAAMDAYWKAEQGIAPDRRDVGSKYDVQWYEKIKKIAEGGGTAADFEDSTAAKYLKEMIELPGIIQSKKLILREKGYRLLEDEIRKSLVPLTDRQKKEKALEIYYNLKAESLTMPEEPSAVLTEEEKVERTELQKAEELGRSLDKAVAENRAFQKRQIATIAQPKTQAEFEQTVKLLARTNRAQAKAYYDKWVSKWQ